MAQNRENGPPEDTDDENWLDGEAQGDRDGLHNDTRDYSGDRGLGGFDNAHRYRNVARAPKAQA